MHMDPKSRQKGKQMRAIAISRTDTSAGQADAADVVTATRLSLVPSSGALERQQSMPVHLTARQLEVLALLCEGLPNKLICRRLNISAGTVKAHISSILRELGVASRLQAVVSARRRGLVSDFGIPERQQDAHTKSCACEDIQDRGGATDFPRRGLLN